MREMDLKRDEPGKPVARPMIGLAIALACLPAPACAQSTAADAFLATPADLSRVGAPPASVSEAPATAPLPVDVDKTAKGVSMRTGLSTLRDYNAKALSRRIESVKGKTPATLKMPKPPVAKPPPIDVWTKLDAEHDAFETNQTVRASVGADYKLLDNATAGISAQQSDTSTPVGVAPAPTDRKLSAYMNLKASSLLSVDAKTQWQRAEADGFSGHADSEHNSFSVAPKLEKKFDLGDGLAIAPYARVKHELDVNVLDGSERTTNAAGGGVTLAKPDAYSVTVSTDVQQSSNSDAPNVNSRLQFKLPLP